MVLIYFMLKLLKVLFLISVYFTDWIFYILLQPGKNEMMEKNSAWILYTLKCGEGTKVPSWPCFTCLKVEREERLTSQMCYTWSVSWDYVKWSRPNFCQIINITRNCSYWVLFANYIWFYNNLILLEFNVTVLEKFRLLCASLLKNSLPIVELLHYQIWFAFAQG